MAARKTDRTLLALSIFTALASASSAPAFAQQAQPASAAEKEATTLDRMVVTAQKREEALQDVPITMNVVPRQLLEDAGIRDIKDLQILVPGLSVTSTANEAQTTARIRGVGTVGDNPGLESSVGVVIDGVYRARNGVGFGDLGELERIEVLKGPQGTVFGKNTSAGLINVITRRPSYSQPAEGEITVGNFGAIGVSVPTTTQSVNRLHSAFTPTKRTRDGFNRRSHRCRST